MSLLEEDKYLMEMASIGDIDNKLIIIIRSNDPENIPHFHICDKTTLGSNFHTCVKIENAEYFHHTGKEDVLNTKQRKALIQFLNSTCDLGISYWKFLIMTWNSNNSSKKISINCKMPDYSEL
jgi:hypothetical protein